MRYPHSASRRAARTGLAVVLACLPWTAAGPSAADESPQGAFYATLVDLCGARFEGEMTFPTEGRDDFSGQLLVAEVESCGEDQVRVPFSVGEDRSRTWIVSRTPDGLQLKHDHRHADGTPDETRNLTAFRELHPVGRDFLLSPGTGEPRLGRRGGRTVIVTDLGNWSDGSAARLADSLN